MFRIRKLSDARTPANRKAVAEAQEIIRAQFPGMDTAEIDKLPDRLTDPIAHRFVAELFVAERRSHVRAVALLLYDPALEFAFLDVIANAPSVGAGSGMGGAVYERLRQEAVELGAKGLYFECLPDQPEQVPDDAVRKQNIARLRFYERFGARPIEGTEYQAPISPGDLGMPMLVFDGLGRHDLPDARTLRQIVEAILERKYGHMVSQGYVELVVGSIRDGGFSLRPPKYVKTPAPAVAVDPPQKPIPLIINDKHDIHHVRERGYVESPVRIPAILGEIEKTGLFKRCEPRHYPDRWIREVHDGSLVDYVKSACAEAPEKSSLYPYVFPVRNAARKPKERSVLAGYWCIDTFTPINRNAWPAARRAADCAITAADEVLNGASLAYALIRPPGHHAERRTFGGFCYICNGAVAANYLSHYGRVAILDIDYHHGNGQQDIFYERGDVLTVSIHGDPSFAYPYFTGFRDEHGRGPGAGYNVNLPLPETITPEQYREALDRAFRRIDDYAPAYLVLSVGFDTGRGDPTGTWPNRASDFRLIGRRIGEAGYPVAVIQEGGYRVRTLGTNARCFFEGLASGVVGAKGARIQRPAGRSAGNGRRTWRSSLRDDDPAKIRQLVAATGMFSAEEEAIAAELAVERIERGRISGYDFILVFEGERILGYTCYGRVPGSEFGWDLYWIAVAPSQQGKGLGARLLERTEAAIRREGGRTVWADTSSGPAYEKTRAFYRARGFTLAADLEDFYRPGDGKTIFRKELGS